MIATIIIAISTTAWPACDRNRDGRLEEILVFMSGPRRR
jgi:hypothetical protein